jgi:uncharacterized protein YlxP (DUF503 family)
MIIGVCTLELSIPAANSLKDRRSVVKSINARLRNEFNVSVAEVGQLDIWRSATVAVVTVSGDKDYAHGLLTRVAQWIERTRLDCELIDYEIELL